MKKKLRLEPSDAWKRKLENERENNSNKDCIHTEVSEQQIDAIVSMGKISGDNEDKFPNIVDAPSESVILESHNEFSVLVAVSFESFPVALKLN